LPKKRQGSQALPIGLRKLLCYGEVTLQQGTNLYMDILIKLVSIAAFKFQFTIKSTLKKAVTR